MFKNYFLISLRRLLRQKMYWLINLSGLTLGFVCAFLIFLFIQNEYQYDRFHADAEQIYKVIRTNSYEDTGRFRRTSGPLAPALMQDFPEIQKAVRIQLANDTWVRYDDKGFYKAVYTADATVFDFFTFPFIQGDPQTALLEPNSVVLTAETARHFFGNVDPMQKAITIERASSMGVYQVTGVIQDVPKNSSLSFDMLKSPSVNDQAWRTWVGEGWRSIETYVRLPKGYVASQLEEKLPGFLVRHLGEKIGATDTYRLQPLSRIHLYSQRDYNMDSPSQGNITDVYAFCFLAIGILLIACINFMNLATAQSFGRAREVGVRKVVGASRTQLIQQFLSESLLIAFMALFVALCVIEFVLPYFNMFVGKDLQLNLVSLYILLPFLAITMITGVISGSYPAIFLSRFKPVSVLKGHLASANQNTYLKKGLVVFQFSISILIMIQTIVVFRQLDYLQTKDLGFNKDHVLVLPLFEVSRKFKVTPNEDLRERVSVIKQTFLNHPNIIKAAATGVRPGEFAWNHTVRTENTRERRTMGVVPIDQDYLDLFDIDLLMGKNFSTTYIGDPKRAGDDQFLINETAAKILGWSNPIGQRLQIRGSRQGVVIGVVKDFHVRSLHNKIEPVVLSAGGRGRSYLNLCLKVRSGSVENTIQFIEQTWHQFLPERPFEFFFLDDHMNQTLYQREIRLSHMNIIFSIIAIFVACLGLFGLTALTTEQRRKEIGIRKVLGASLTNLVVLFSKDFLKLLIVANVIAVPISYFIIVHWLQNFAYQIPLGVEPFVLGAACTGLLAFMTVGLRIYQSTCANPVETLRSE